MSVSGNAVFFVYAQDPDHTAINDTIYLNTADSIEISTLIKEDTVTLKQSINKASSFKPIPKRAVLYSAIFPGLGQIYNKKYWKLPVIYGGFVGFIYAITWNNKTYQDYSAAYVDLHNDREKNAADPEQWHKSWQVFVPAGREASEYINNSNFESSLRNSTNSFRRYRDLSIILSVAWYFLCIADSYVDAQLFDFDITPDLSMRIEPVVTPKTRHSSDLYGINCCIKF
jgi:hypothetical protein